MLKYSPQYMLTKDVASAYARKGLGLKERIPKVYRDLLNKIIWMEQARVSLILGKFLR